MRGVPSSPIPSTPDPPAPRRPRPPPGSTQLTHKAFPPEAGESTRRWVIASMCLVLIALLTGFAVLIRQNDAEAHRSLSDRFETRATLTATFTQDYVNDLAVRQRSQAERLLAGPEADQHALESVVRAFGFESAVVLDRNGRLLQAWPARPDLIGRDITVDQAHLRTAVAGRIGLSDIVPSTVRGEFVVALAVPFDSAAGRRVFSGSFSPASTPLGAYLDSVVPMTGGTAYLVGHSGAVVAGGRGVDDGLGDDELADLPIGVSELRSGRLTAAVAVVPDTPWRVITVAPTERLYESATAAHPAPWVLWFALAVSGGVMVVLVVQLQRARAHAAATARTDSLTGLPNRRAMQEALDMTASLASRHDDQMVALMIDIDRFKTINDTHGHDAGDLVIRAFAVALVDAVRDSDVAGRWGGEEFLVLLPRTDLAAAVRIAERIRVTIASTIVSAVSDGHPVTASIGVATLRQGDTDRLLREADEALYRAKANGRNRVEISFDVDGEGSGDGRVALNMGTLPDH